MELDRAERARLCICGEAHLASGATPSTLLPHWPSLNSFQLSLSVTSQPSVHITSKGGNLLTTCGDTQHCLSVYWSQSGMSISIARTADDGATWTVSLAPPDWRTYPLDLSCPTGTDCYVSTVNNIGGFSDPTVENTSDGGATWTTVGLPTVNGSSLGSVRPLSCPTVDGCLGVAALPTQSSSLLVSSLPGTHDSTP